MEIGGVLMARLSLFQETAFWRGALMIYIIYIKLDLMTTFNYTVIQYADMTIITRVFYKEKTNYTMQLTLNVYDISDLIIKSKKAGLSTSI